MVQRDHFQSATAEEHIKQVQDRHGICLGEPHTSKRGFIFHLLRDVLTMGSFFFFIRTIFFLIPVLLGNQIKIFLSIGIGWSFYSGCMQARKAWAYLELCHRYLWQEKMEIDQNFKQECEELQAIYYNRGFRDPLLRDIVQFISSDINLMLDTMIREELHLRLGDYPHPLKQGGVRTLGGILGMGIFLPFALCASYTLSGILSGIAISSLAFAQAKLLNNDPIIEAVWVLGIFLTSASLIYSCIQLF